MDPVQIRAKVQQIVIEHLDLDEDEARADARFLEDLGADSLDRVELQLALEDAFAIEISDAEGETLPTVGQLTDHVLAKVAAKAVTR